MLSSASRSLFFRRGWTASSSSSSSSLGRPQSSPRSVASRLPHRTFVSEAFACEAACRQHLDSHPALAKLDMGQFFFDLERKFSREKRGSAIDIDLFANRAGGDEQLEHLEVLMHQFRRTPQTCLTLPSTAHLVVRQFVRAGDDAALVRMLDDRLNYGLFPDTHALVFLLDHQLEKGAWRGAAKVASYIMLQEEEQTPVAREMALYGAWRYLTSDAWPEDVWDAADPNAEPEPEDEVKVRVDYLDNNYHDDHFDLRKKEHLVGKSLARLARGLEDQVLSRSLQLVGWALFEKWDKVKQLLAESDKDLAESCIELVQAAAAECGDAAVKDELLQMLFDAKKSATKTDVADSLKQLVQQAVAEHEPGMIEEQNERIRDWGELRKCELDRETKLYLREARREDVARKKAEFALKEEELFFFERQEEFERRKEEKYDAWIRKMPPRTWSRRIKLRAKTVVSHDYVPPEIKVEDKFKREE